MIVCGIRCGLTIEEFWKLTPHEFNLVVKANSQDQEAKQYLVAWHASLMLNCWGKKGTKITPDRLLGKTRKGEVKSVQQLVEIKKVQTERADKKDERMRSIRKFGD